MPDPPKEGLARRDSMITALATVGAAVALAASSKSVNAQKPVATPAVPARQGTAHVGDVIQGKKVISALDISDLEPSKRHSFHFQGVHMTVSPDEGRAAGLNNGDLPQLSLLERDLFGIAMKRLNP